MTRNSSAYSRSIGTGPLCARAHNVDRAYGSSAAVDDSVEPGRPVGAGSAAALTGSSARSPRQRRAGQFGERDLRVLRAEPRIDQGSEKMRCRPIRRQRIRVSPSTVTNSNVARPSGEANDQVISQTPEALVSRLTRRAAGQIWNRSSTGSSLGGRGRGRGRAPGWVGPGRLLDPWDVQVTKRELAEVPQDVMPTAQQHPVAGERMRTGADVLGHDRADRRDIPVPSASGQPPWTGTTVADTMTW